VTILSGILLAAPLVVHSASAEGEGTPHERNLAKSISLVSVAEVFSVPRRAPREILLSVTAPSSRPPAWVRLERTDSRSLGAERASDGPGFKIAGISLVPQRSSTQKGPNDRLGDASVRNRWSESRNATSSGLSLDAVSGIGWLVGALGIGVGTYLLVTSDKSKGHETTVGPDFYSKGAGLRVRRRW